MSLNTWAIDFWTTGSNQQCTSTPKAKSIIDNLVLSSVASSTVITCFKTAAALYILSCQSSGLPWREAEKPTHWTACRNLFEEDHTNLKPTNQFRTMAKGTKFCSHAVIIGNSLLLSCIDSEFTGTVWYSTRFWKERGFPDYWDYLEGHWYVSRGIEFGKDWPVYLECLASEGLYYILYRSVDVHLIIQNSSRCTQNSMLIWSKLMDVLLEVWYHWLSPLLASVVWLLKYRWDQRRLS